jgi:hypothetical protein
MKTNSQYFILPGRYTLPSSFLIKFDGQYSFWGSESKKWIYDTTVFKQDWVDDKCIPITEIEANKIIKGGVPPLNYRRVNPKMAII